MAELDTHTQPQRPPGIVTGRELLRLGETEEDFYIQGLLPTAGRMMIVADAGMYKSWLLMQLGFALASGQLQWLGLDFPKPALRVLLFQPELTDREVERRFLELLASVPDGFDMNAVLNNFHVQLVRDWRPEISTPDGQAKTDARIEAIKPAVVLFDSLSFLLLVEDENSSKEMGQVFRYLDSLIDRFGCALILTHHTNRTGSYRGSSKLAGWADTLLNMKVSGKVAVVEGKYRAMENPGLLHWRRPEGKDLWFQPRAGPTPSAAPPGAAPLQPAPSGRKSKASLEDVASIVREAGNGIPYADLVERIASTYRLAKSTAKAKVGEAVAGGKIVNRGGTYYVS
jgi:hypothetical protein